MIIKTIIMCVTYYFHILALCIQFYIPNMFHLRHHNDLDSFVGMGLNSSPQNVLVCYNLKFVKINGFLKI